MPRRGYSATIGKFAKFYQDRRKSEIRLLSELLRREQHAAAGEDASPTAPQGPTAQRPARRFAAR